MAVARAMGLEVAYDRVGHGAPLLLLHGAAEDARIWTPQLEALSDEFTVTAWDQPGSRRSSDAPPNLGIEGFADCAAAVIDDVGLGPAHVAGLSWGGIVAQELYRRHPDRVASLVLVDTYAGWKGSLPEEEYLARVEGLRRMLAAPPEEFDPTLPGLLAHGPPAAYAGVLEEMAADVRRQSIETLFANAHVDTSAVLADIAVPTLLVWGELDARSPPEVARQFERAIPHAELVLIGDAGHLSSLEQPERFNDAVRRFCRAHPPQRRAV